MPSELSRHTFVCLMLLSSPRVFCFSTFCSWTPCTCIPAVWEVRQLSKPQSVCSDYSFCGNSILLPHLCLAEPTWRAKLGNTSPWRPYLPLSLEQSSPVSLPWPTLPHPPPPAIEPPTFPSLPRGTGRKCFQMLSESKAETVLQRFCPRG